MHKTNTTDERPWRGQSMFIEKNSRDEDDYWLEHTVKMKKQPERVMSVFFLTHTVTPQQPYLEGVSVWVSSLYAHTHTL